MDRQCMHWTVKYALNCTVWVALHSFALCCIALQCAAWGCIVLHCAALCCTVLRNLRCAALCCTTLHCLHCAALSALCCTICIVLHCAAWSALCCNVCLVLHSLPCAAVCAAIYVIIYGFPQERKTFKKNVFLIMCRLCKKRSKVAPKSIRKGGGYLRGRNLLNLKPLPVINKRSFRVFYYRGGGGF